LLHSQLCTNKISIFFSFLFKSDSFAAGKTAALTQIFLYISIAFIAGFVLAWVLRTLQIQKIRKIHKSTEGLLESEKLMKEKLRKENQVVYQQKEIQEAEFSRKLKEAEQQNRVMDEDILLLQKHYEETEALLKAGQPEIHQLKLKLIEANNTIARYKAQLGLK
jgi:uncharacterized protein HemX